MNVNKTTPINEEEMTEILSDNDTPPYPQVSTSNKRIGLKHIELCSRQQTFIKSL